MSLAQGPGDNETIDAVAEMPLQPLSPRKRRILKHANRTAHQRDSRIVRNRFYHEDDRRYMRFLVPEGMRVLELGCGTGQLLAALQPAAGVGVDFSPNMVAIAREKHPECTFLVGDVEDERFLSTLPGPFDVIVLSDTIGSLQDCISTIQNLAPPLHPRDAPDRRLLLPPVGAHPEGWRVAGP